MLNRFRAAGSAAPVLARACVETSYLNPNARSSSFSVPTPFNRRTIAMAASRGTPAFRSFSRSAFVSPTSNHTEPRVVVQRPGHHRQGDVHGSTAADYGCDCDSHEAVRSGDGVVEVP